MSGEKHKVILHVYDLSQGLAKQMSMGILGKQIDGIWHTGVVVYGKEYFFGGGIQSAHPMTVAASFGINPTQRIELGETEVSKADFEAWVRSVSPRFTVATYDLFSNNCNNFSDEAAKFLLGAGIPSHIVELPGEFLATPLGQMLRPMIQGMQQNMYERVGAEESGAGPAASAAAPAPAAAAAPDLGGTAGALAALFGGGAGGMGAAAGGGWGTGAGGGGHQVPSLTPIAAPGASHVPAPHEVRPPPVPTPITAPAARAPTSVLKTHVKPLLSADTRTVKPVVARVLKAATGEVKCDGDLCTMDPAVLPLSDREKAVLEAMGGYLVELKTMDVFTRAAGADGASGGAGAGAGAGSAAPALPAVLGEGEAPAGLAEFFAVVAKATSCKKTAFAGLCLLRVAVLHPAGAAYYCQGEGRTAMRAVLGALSTGAYETPASQLMAFAVASNLFAHAAGVTFVTAPDQAPGVIEAALRELAAERKDVRQMAAALLYNFSYHLEGAAKDGDDGSEGEVPDSTVQVIMALLEGVDEESDAECQRRRLLGAGRLLLRHGADLAPLVMSLGFEDSLDAMARKADLPGAVRDLAREVHGALMAAVADD